MSSRFMKLAAAPALALATASLPFAGAVAQERPVAMQPAAANANVQQVAFQTLDGSTRTPDFVRTGAAMASRDKIAIVVWGGNRDLQRQAYDAALDLRDQGIPLAFIVGPSQLPTNNATMIEIYGRGVSATQLVIGQDNIANLRGDVRSESQAAYGRMFPRELAALDPR
ncbi:MAG: hypothetical protein AB7E85_08660 [Pseudobdellovibrionaceae bacterium]